VLVCLSFALGACGIPTGAPKPVPSGQVPGQLVSPNPPTTDTTIPSGGVPFEVYLINAQNQLQGYNRTVALHAGLIGILDYLVAGPSLPELEADVTTAIPSGTRVLSVTAPTKSDNVVTVDFSTDFGDPVSEVTQIQAIAQVVYTIASAEPLQPTSALFEIDGALIDVPTGNGTETAQPVTVADYPGVVTTTTTTGPAH
jgi:spore germination protein GerM